MTPTWPPLNLWAVLVAAVATFLLGGVWYQALFGKLWVKLYGYTPEQTQAMQKARPPAVFFGTMFFAYLLMATAMGFLVYWAGAHSAFEGALLGVAVWGVTVAIAITDFITSTKKPGIYYIDCSYQFIFLVMTGMILAAWQ